MTIGLDSLQMHDTQRAAAAQVRTDGSTNRRHDGTNGHEPTELGHEHGPAVPVAESYAL
jgi:hypothetical protein